MSTILKALRRVEDDRNVRESRPLREQVATASERSGPSRGSRLLLLLGLGAGVAVGAGVLAFAAVSRSTPSNTSKASSREFAKLMR